MGLIEALHFFFAAAAIRMVLASLAAKSALDLLSARAIGDSENPVIVLFRIKVRHDSPV
jgi:hypothetical protein